MTGWARVSGHFWAGLRRHECTGGNSIASLSMTCSIFGSIEIDLILIALLPSFKFAQVLFLNAHVDQYGGIWSPKPKKGM